jgi:hypothetical protein
MILELLFKYAVPVIGLITTIVVLVRYFTNMEKEIETLKKSLEEVKETLKYIQYNLIDKKKIIASKNKTDKKTKLR